ncbi:MAG TPA: metallophosphoesterase [Gaiellaceae bacterium]|nr:metallophosphoesterase [Gaiellaceae bacterium]
MGLVALAAAVACYAWFEAGWVRLRVRELELPGLPPELDGLRIAHLSDFHLGVPSRGVRAVERAVDWVAARGPDLVCITGDLLSRPRGERQLRELLGRLRHPYVVLGNHDYAISRDPFSRRVEIGPLENGTILFDSSVDVEVRGRRIELAGVDPRTWIEKRKSAFPPSDAELRILLCHFPRALDSVAGGRFDLILAGHLHAGQIVLPYGFGKLLLAHPGARYPEGVFERNGTVMHVSPGLGTTFVPFRFFARPEATELVLRSRMRH